MKKIYFIIAGILSVSWFLIRVIPKPSRASYPCQRAAFPVASAFVLWLVSVIGASLVLKTAKRKFQQSKYVYSGGLFLVCLIIVLNITITYNPSEILASKLSQNEGFIPIDKPNEPFGEGIGIFPGRVVWSHNPAVASWNGVSGFWWSDSSIDSEKLKYMLSKGIMKLTNTDTDATAWEALFRYFNKKHNKGDVGYVEGEKIAIKINMNMVAAHNQKNNVICNSPAMILSLLRQLINEAKVPASAITLYDISRHIPNHIFDPCKAEFPDVHFIDNSQGQNGREPFQLDIKTQINWSDDIPNGKPSYLPSFVTEANYIINLANLKGHALAGVTMCAKNHFGSYASFSHGDNGPMDAGVHAPIAVHYDSWSGSPMREMGTYNALVDIMGHDDLGKKTLLFIFDALYNTGHQNDKVSTDYKMEMTPFFNHWMSSLFLSQDGVAIESVGLDFLRNETGKVGDWVYGNVDNYLHEAANAGNAPSGIMYDPENDGTKLTSLGVHEHWNDHVNKQYSRNLGKDKGIELIYIDATSGATATSAMNFRRNELKVFPNPVVDNLNLVINKNVKGEVDVFIYTLEGKLKLRFSINTTEVKEFQFNLSELQAGNYIVSISAKELLLKQKFVKL